MRVRNRLAMLTGGLKRGAAVDRLTSMEVFVRIVDLGGIKAAADACGISPTMAGNHLRAIENRLGARLLNRTTRRQSLTEIGLSFYQQCQDVISRVDAAESNAREMQQEPRGRLRISAPTTLGTHLLAPILATYLQQFEQVEIDLQLNDRIVDLAEEGFDVAFRFGILSDSGLIARPLQSPTRFLCASPDYLDRRGSPKNPSELTAHNCLAFRYITPEREWKFAGEQPMSINLTGQLTVNNGVALLHAAVQGLGLVLLPNYLVQDEIDRGRLVRLFPDNDFPRAPLQMVYLPDRHMTPKMKSFVDFITSTLRRE